MNVVDRLSFFASLYKVHTHPEQGMWFLYVTVLILSAIVYRLGFAKKLPLLKNVIIYVLLALGCTILTFFAVFLPVAEGLVVAALVLIIYKVRLHQAKKREANAEIRR
ncbi:YlaH-like family protein [Thermaerobacillus caldiproteolyticus]|uniref:Vacuolar-type H+-ATPase subunit I/STV1 n=1 Tax=Thermaerobacillus caldiproteolyticus TaxID=247480 RepID=A0A7W0BY12_9BACL|nr:YlaH-like family protein [Anoxybacillus caldiproteolyticus]MBA2874135.1 vacuolar-type H+-ATPase subunit I/STV1 [Anoxybacillus caldiproteolyticus]QPA31914.1 YlaH-like family protein [Anoxybacillus caldiproteolyticus]